MNEAKQKIVQKIFRGCYKQLGLTAISVVLVAQSCGQEAVSDRRAPRIGAACAACPSAWRAWRPRQMQS